MPQPHLVLSLDMPPRQRVSANAIRALKDALTDAFWFKRDLYNYAKAAVGGEPMFLSGIGWTGLMPGQRGHLDG